MNRIDKHLRLWVDAIRGEDVKPETAERLLNACICHAIDEWPVELVEIEQLSDWTGPGLLKHAMSAKAPPGIADEGSQGEGTFTAGFLLTLRQLQLIGKLVSATEQALHLEDVKTAHSMTRLMRREWEGFKGGLALEAAFAALVAMGLDDGEEA